MNTTGPAYAPQGIWRDIFIVAYAQPLLKEFTAITTPTSEACEYSCDCLFDCNIHSWFRDPPTGMLPSPCFRMHLQQEHSPSRHGQMRVQEMFLTFQHQVELQDSNGHVINSTSFSKQFQAGSNAHQLSIAANGIATML